MHYHITVRGGILQSSKVQRSVDILSTYPCGIKSVHEFEFIVWRKEISVAAAEAKVNNSVMD